MFAGQRLNIIRQVLLKDRQVDIASLASLLEVSDVTVRKDLTTLEEEGFLRKIHGGAVLADSHAPLPAASDAEQDRLTGLVELALSLVSDHDSLFLGTEPACTALAKQLDQRKNLTILTNNVAALPFLDPATHNILFMGGTVVKCGEQQFTHGKKTLQFLDDMFVSKAFIGADCVDLDIGVTTNQLLALDIYEQILSVSRQTILLATSDQFNKTAIQRVCPVSQFQAVVTDSLIPDNVKTYCFSRNIKLLTSIDL